MADSGTPSRHGIISAGTWCVDRIKLVNQWPQEEHLADIVGTDQQGGGSAHNLGVDIRKLDSAIPVEAIGLTGSDEGGNFLLSKASQAGIDTSQLHRSTDTLTSFTDVISSAKTGKRTFFHYRGANDLLSPDHFDFSHTNGRILHLGLIGVHALLDAAWKQDPNGWVSVLKSAQQAGIKTNLELVSIAPEKIRQIALPCLAHLDTLIVNEYELSALSNSDTCDGDGELGEKLCANSAEKLFEYSDKHNGNLSLVVVHNPKHAFAITADKKTYSQPCFRIDKSHIKSSVGAGDAFAAGMLYGIHEQWDLDSTLELAHAVAASSLRSATTVGAVESVHECLSFARSNSEPLD